MYGNEKIKKSFEIEKFISTFASVEKVTINDIARLTGLSKGTVDRVLHNRGEVSKKSFEKVMAVIREQGYEPNLYASFLANKKKRVIAIVLPHPEPGSYWELATSGIQKIGEEEQPFGIETSLVTYNEFQADSFREACTKVLQEQVSGVVIAPMFQYETQVFVQELGSRNIPYVFVDTKLDTPDGHLAFFGIPSYKSGFLCADMLLQGEKAQEVLVVRITRDKERQSDPTLIRRAGFLDYMREHNPGCTIRSLFVSPTDAAVTDEALSSFFKEFPQVKHVVMFNSRIHLIVPFLERHPFPGRRVIGFDNLDANLRALENGTVTMLIAQHPERQVQEAVHSLSEFLVFRRKPKEADNHMHMDLLTRFNIEDY